MNRIITILLFSVSFFCKAQWNLISTGQSYYYFSSQSWGRDTVFATGYEFVAGVGHVMASFNGGSSWTDQTLPAAMPQLYALCFADKNNGFAGGQNGKLIKTTNLGSSWFNLSSGITSQITDLYFVDKDTGYASAGAGIIIKTKDGGVNWNILSTGTSMIIHSVCFPTPKTGYAVAYSNPVNGGIILKSNDYGNTWTQQTSPVFGTLTIRGQKVRFANQDSGMIVGLGGAMLYTHNGGQNWNVTGSGMTTNNLNDVQFDYAGRAVICGNQGRIYKTTDFGVTISNHGSLSTSADYYTVDYANDSTAYMFGTNGGALKSSSVFPGWEEIESDALFNMFPNPSFNQVIIVSEKNFSSVCVRNISGQLLLEAKTDLSKEVTLDVSKLAAGIYFVELSMVNGVWRKRMVKAE